MKRICAATLAALGLASPAAADDGRPERTRAEVFASTGLFLMDTAYTEPVQGIGGSIEVDDRQIGGLGFNLGVALRHHYARHFGIQGRLSGGHHWMSINYGDGPDTAAGGLTHFTLDVSHLFGPFGRYYVGPNVLWSWMTFSRDVVRVPTTSNVLVDTRLHPGFALGVGVDMGLYLGRDRDVDLNLRWNVSKQFDAPSPAEGGDLILRMELGVGYAFF